MFMLSQVAGAYEVLVTRFHYDPHILNMHGAVFRREIEQVHWVNFLHPHCSQYVCLQSIAVNDFG